MDERRFAIVPPGKWVFLFPVLITALVVVGVAVSAGMGQREPLPWPAWIVLATMPLIGGLLGWEMSRRDVRLGDKGLRLGHLPWRSRVALEDLDLAHAEIVDLQARSELLPRIKIIGARLPGYRAGSFWLRDGRRASVLLTDLNRVLLLPRRNGTLILLSLEQPEALLQALRRRG